MGAQYKYPTYATSTSIQMRRIDDLPWIPSGAVTTAGHTAWPVDGDATAFGWAALVGWSKRWVEWIRSERRIRRATHELMAMDDRMLADIGLSRADLAYGARYGRLPGREPDGVQ
jgi:uncharacterized protein YjiS (DUF1127 family)